MAKKTVKRPKHVPQRTCVGCRQTLAKRSLIRIVRTPEGLRVDPTGKLAGRGAYLHDRKSCWERGLKGALAHALKMELSDQDRQMMRDFVAALPEDELDGTDETVSLEQPAAASQEMQSQADPEPESPERQGPPGAL